MVWAIVDRFSSYFELSPEEIRSGRLSRILVVLAIPLLAQNLVRGVNRAVDLFWLGRLGSDAVSAVGLASPVMSLLLASAIYAPYLGTQVIVSNRVGSERLHAARESAFAGLLLAAAFGLVVGIGVYFAAPAALGLLVEVQPQSNSFSQLAVSYLQILSLGIVLTGMSDVLEAGFIGWGDTRAALYINVTAVVGNLILDPLLIFGYGPVPALGIEGAALATVSGHTTGLVLAIVLLFTRSYDVLSLNATTFDLSEYRGLLDVGVPAGLQRVTRPIAELLLVTVVFAVGGAAALAAYFVGNRVAFVALIPSRAFKQAAQSVVGQNLGGDLPHRARRTVWIGIAITSSVLAVLAVVQWFTPRMLVTLFAPTLDGQALQLGIDFVRVFAIGYPALGAFSLFQAGFNGAKRTRISLVGSVVKNWGIRLPVAIVGGLVLGHGTVAVFAAIPASDIVTAFLFGAYYHHSTKDGLRAD